MRAVINCPLREIIFLASFLNISHFDINGQKNLLLSFQLSLFLLRKFYTMRASRIKFFMGGVEDVLFFQWFTPGHFDFLPPGYVFFPWKLTTISFPLTAKISSRKIWGIWDFQSELLGYWTKISSNVRKKQTNYHQINQSSGFSIRSNRLLLYFRINLNPFRLFSCKIGMCFHANLHVAFWLLKMTLKQAFRPYYNVKL